MTHRCPFCDATLAVGERQESCGGETGGVYTAQRYQCAACCVDIGWSITYKIFDLSETWILWAAPLAAKVTQRSHPTFPVYTCPRCTSGDLVPAVPIGALPVPDGELPVSPDDPLLADHPPKRQRHISYLCNACAAQCSRCEHGNFGALVVSGWSSGSSLMPDAPRQRPKADL